MITSLANGRIKHLAQLREKGSIRNKEGLFLAEGVKMFEEAPVQRIREVYISETFWERLQEENTCACDCGGDVQQEAGFKNKAVSIQQGAALGSRSMIIWKKLSACIKEGVWVEQVSEEVFRKAADTQTPQGILFVMGQSVCSLEALLQQAVERERGGGRPPLFLLLEDIQDPGNLGTMVRTGEGAGVDGIILGKGCVDIYNPKVIRSTMGSLYRVPFLYAEELGRVISLLKQKGIRVYAAHLKGERYFDEISYEGGTAFLVGNEARGLKEETARAADIYVKIPMEGALESLNAAVAAALLLYQAAGCVRKRES